MLFEVMMGKSIFFSSSVSSTKSSLSLLSCCESGMDFKDCCGRDWMRRLMKLDKHIKCVALEASGYPLIVFFFFLLNLTHHNKALLAMIDHPFTRPNKTHSRRRFQHFLIDMCVVGSFPLSLLKHPFKHLQTCRICIIKLTWSLEKMSRNEPYLNHCTTSLLEVSILLGGCGSSLWQLMKAVNTALFDFIICPNNDWPAHVA